MYIIIYIYIIEIYILKFVDFKKTQKYRYLENEIFFLYRKKFINYTLRV